jgi:hypothetical protein
MRWVAIVGALFVLPLAAQQPADDALKAQLLASPPAAVLDLAKRVSPRDHNVPIDVQFLRADLDGSGKFQYIVAFFFTAEVSQDGFLRVFKQNGTALQVVGDEEAGDSNGGAFARLELVDVNDDGIPEIKVTGTGASGAHSSFDLFLWTGSSLHCMTKGVDTDDAYLADVDGDGQLEVISVPYIDVNAVERAPYTGFGIYKLQGSDYKFERDSGLDPTGDFDGTGNITVIRFHTRTEPDHFSLEQVQRAVKRGDGDDQDVVHIVIRHLRAPGNKPVTVDQIDPSTIVLDHSIRPLRVRLVRGEVNHNEGDADEGDKRGRNDDGDERQGTVLRAEFSRQAVLQRLPRQDLTKPLGKGDKVGIAIRAKLKDGRTARGSVNVTIAGEGDGEHHDKD